MSNGLFQRAIMQSGVTLSPGWHLITQDEASSWGYAFAKNLDCQWCSEEALVECLQNKSTTEIAYGEIGGTKWMPTIESTFLPKTPLEILESGDFNKEVQIIIGSNADDGLLNLWEIIKDPTLLDDCRANFDVCLPMSLFYLNDWEITKEDIDEARK